MLTSRSPKSHLIVPALLLCVTGCHRQTSFSISAPPLPAIKTNDYTTSDYASDARAYECAAEPNPRPAGTGLTPCPTAAVSPAPTVAPVPGAPAATVDSGMKVRNKIVYNLMAEIDAVYGEYNLRLYAGKGAEAVTFDSLVLGLTSASTIATHAATKTLLSALGTAFSGVGLSVDKNVFAQQTFQVIAIAMQTRRDKIRTAIRGQLTQDTVAYPLAAAKRDLIAYYYAGTLPGGLEELQEEAGVATAANSNNQTPSPTSPGPGPGESPQPVSSAPPPPLGTSPEPPAGAEPPPPPLETIIPPGTPTHLPTQVITPTPH